MDRSIVLKNRLRAEQVAALFQHVALGVTGAASGALVLAGSMIQLGALDLVKGASWALYICACAAAHIMLWRLYLHAKPNDDQWKIWALVFTAISAAEGVGWGWGSVSLVGNTDRFSLEMLVMVVTLSVAGGAIPAFSSYLPAFFAFFLPATIPSIFWSVASKDLFPEALVMLLLMLIFTTAMGGLGVRANQSFKELVNLRIRTDELADDLLKQKELAEQASLAKSSFLAAASHDLRQPVHALGLFVGALRAIAMPPEGVRLIERIEESVVAMDGLFSAILDISRLDAGVIEVRPEAFAIQPLLDRICADYAGEAREKSITLIRCRCSATILTDPPLLERILRNLVSNAVRHTASGRVLVGCRRSAGRVRVEVWDTGPGIPLHERERIFQEYFQLRNPERDRSMGLGLGLAIVRRLGILLDCPIGLRSQPGQGSCFSVEVPMATGPADPAKFAATASTAEAARGLIVVVDDEAAIRDAMYSLLTSWGYAVIAAGSGAEVTTLLLRSARRPDLIICDYRLREEENGIDVVGQLRRQCKGDVPAMLITGDTAADRLKEAQASGLLLLHKPVPNGKLRAAVANLIAVSAQASPH
ncbi:MAG: response regulator [Rhizobiales bacterium]|nr:response regulator [Hyphomicrobiales bacterium]